MGKIIRENSFMKELNRDGQIRIYLPKNYSISDKHYPVIYMHDGQNLFDVEDSSFGNIWNAHGVLSYFESAEIPKEYIIVGIDNGKERYNEYSPWEYENLYEEITISKAFPEKVGGKGSLYGDYIVNTLKPYIDNKYRTLKDQKNTWIMGSSMGALISLFIGLRFPELFGKIGAISPAVWFAEKSLLEYCNKPLRNQKIYMDIGTEESSGVNVSNFPEIYLTGAIKLSKIIEKNIDDKNNMKFVIDEGAEHNEKAWKKRLPSIIEWLS
ncbi:MAG: carbohydrate esterase [Clostridiales bacterium]|jgi:predicted alpha/beta superfamily hydrolase|nr:carbohydrate esterase [Clostridiales bacterium]